MFDEMNDHLDFGKRLSSYKQWKRYILHYDEKEDGFPFVYDNVSTNNNKV